MKLLFMGRKAQGAEALQWSLEQGIEVVGVLTDAHLDGSPTLAMAQQHGLPVWTLEAVYQALNERRLAFDLAVSYVYWRILKEPLLSAPPLGVINFHPAPLPELKGTGGYNLAILDGLTEYAVTAHYVDAGIDTGPVIERDAFAIDPETETALSLEARSQRRMLDLYKRTLGRVLQQGRLPAMPHEGGRYISRKEMESLKEIQPGDDVDRKVRAFWFPPYTGAYVTIDGRKYTLVNDGILRELAPDATSLFSEPGASR